MICVRCGWCCKWLAVIVVRDPAIGPPMTLDDSGDNLILHRGEGKPCPHLRGDRFGEYECTIHNKPWYPQTPCFHHSQIESSPDALCRRGALERDLASGRK